MYANREWLLDELQGIRDAGLYKHERVITSPQGAEVSTDDGTALNFCANNYLGLSSHPEVLAAARGALDRYGYGHSNANTLDLIDPDKVVGTGIDDPAGTFSRGVFTYAIPPPKKAKLYQLWFEAQAGLD